MRIESPSLQPGIDGPEGEVSERRVRLDALGPSNGEAEIAAITPLPAPPAVPWLEPALGGRAALGTPDHYLPMLQSLCDELAFRQDPVARFGLTALTEELDRHALLSAHLNSLIA